MAPVIFTSCKILIGSPGPLAKPSRGAVDDDGNAWEIGFKGSNDAMRKYVFQVKKAGGYDAIIANLDGEDLVLERPPRGILSPWRGLERTGAWVDESCEGCPWQQRCLYLWTTIGRGLREVTLYIRHRRWGLPVDPLWQGHVVLGTGRVLIHDEWSPDLLPKLHPDDAPPYKGLLFTVREPVGLLEDQVAEAKRALEIAAWTWLNAKFPVR